MIANSNPMKMLFPVRFLMKLLLLLIVSSPILLQAQNNGWETIDYDSREHPFKKKNVNTYDKLYTEGGRLISRYSSGQLTYYGVSDTIVYSNSDDLFKSDWCVSSNDDFAALIYKRTYLNNQYKNLYQLLVEENGGLKSFPDTVINERYIDESFTSLHNTRKNIWFRTSGELIRYDKDLENFHIYDSSYDYIKAGFSIYSNNSSYLLLLNSGNLYVYKDGESSFHRVEVEDSIVSHVPVKSQRTFWYGEKIGYNFYFFKGKSKSFYRYDASGIVKYDINEYDQLGNFNGMYYVPESNCIGVFDNGLVVFGEDTTYSMLYGAYQDVINPYVNDTLFCPRLLDNGILSFQLYGKYIYDTRSYYCFTSHNGELIYHYKWQSDMLYEEPIFHYRTLGDDDYFFRLEGGDYTYTKESSLVIIKNSSDTIWVNLPITQQTYFGPGDLYVDSNYVWLRNYDWGENETIWRLKREKSFIRGKVFYDSNQNGIQDADEYSVNKYPVLIHPTGLKIFPSRNGSFAFPAQAGVDYTLEIPADSLFDYTSKPLPLTLDYDIENQVGVTLKNPDYHIGTNLNLPWPRCNTNSFAWLELENTGFLSIQDVRLKLVADQPVSLEPVDGSVVDDTLVFEIADLKPRESLQLWYKIQWPGASFTGRTVNFRLSAEIHEHGRLYQQLKDSIATIVRCSYDPNDKSVTPVGVGDRNYTLMDSSFTYLIRFENTGNDTAYHVTIYDTLDVHLNKNSFKLLGASHDVVTSIDKHGIVTFYFENIMLPDSATDKEKAQGFVRYYIEPRSGLPEETEIANKAGIVFDSNEPIITNTVINTMVTTLPTITTLSHRQKHTSFAYPNPASDKIYLGAGCRRTEIYNAVGILISTSDSKTILVSDWPEGLYLIKCYDENSELIAADRVVIKR